jgi:hypothetical protein
MLADGEDAVDWAKAAASTRNAADVRTGAFTLSTLDGPSIRPTRNRSR